MALGDALKKFREEPAYQGEKEESNDSPRMICLTDDEAKSLGGGEQGDGSEKTFQVTGRLSGNELSVTSIQVAEKEPDEKEMASEVMAKMGPPSY